jgi:hypothetical protein
MSASMIGCGGGSSALAPTGTTLPASTSAVNDRGKADITIEGKVESTGTSQGFHAVLALTSGGSATVFSSEITAAVPGDTVSATGYYQGGHSNAFLAESARIVSSSGNITITGTVTSTGTTGGFHAALSLAGGATAVVYSSEITAAVTGDTVTATGHYQSGSTTTFLAAKASIVSGPPSSGTTTVGEFQIFDEDYHTITPGEAEASGPRYSVIWGARVGMAPYWRAHAPNLKVSYYMPLSNDFSANLWGGIGHDLAWWQKYHPTWILYSCNRSGYTRNVQFQSSFPGQPPLDIHNPEVVYYQIATAAAYAKREGYNAIGVDQVVLFNSNYNTSNGYYACGIWNSNGTFTRRYSENRYDPNVAADTVNWVKTAHAYFRSQGLTLIVNSPAGPLSPDVESILQNTDYDLNETGFTDYGYYTRSNTLSYVTIPWMQYAQGIGTGVLTNGSFSGTSPLNSYQREYAVATHLLGESGKAALYAGPSNDYGGEMYYPVEYTTNYGSACGSTTSTSEEGVYERKFQNAFVAVNSNASQSLYIALPSGHSYRDLEGRSVSNPLRIAPADAYVLLTSGGCT